MTTDNMVERAARAFEAKALSLCQERGETHLSPGLDEMDEEMRTAFYACLSAALATINSTDGPNDNVLREALTEISRTYGGGAVAKKHRAIAFAALANQRSGSNG